MFATDIRWCICRQEHGASVGYHVLYLVCVEIVVCGVLIAAARVAVLELVAIKCCSVDCVLVGAWMPASGVV